VIHFWGAVKGGSCGDLSLRSTRKKKSVRQRETLRRNWGLVIPKNSYIRTVSARRGENQIRRESVDSFLSNSRKEEFTFGAVESLISARA